MKHKRQKRYFKEYWIRDDLFHDPPITYCQLYMKRHKWWPFWKKAGRYSDEEDILASLKNYMIDYDVYLKHPVYGYIDVYKFLTTGRPI